MASWQIEGQYFETCNCEFLCPCITTSRAAAPTLGDCKAAICLRIDKGHKDDVKLDGVTFIVFLYAPGKMSDGNFTVGLIIDDKATDAQADAVSAIGFGQVGGPMAGFAALTSKVAGVERRPISFVQNGLRYTLKAGELVDHSIDGVPGRFNPAEPVYIDNTGHPANKRLALAKSSRSHLHAFGIDWDDTSGDGNGHFAPFNWAA